MHFIQNFYNSPFCCLVLSTVIDTVHFCDLLIFLFKACGDVEGRYRVHDTIVHRFSLFDVERIERINMFMTVYCTQI
jgi:hypothetical protein